ncbi:MAG: hypothetical protein F6K40_12275 [Okeania sp. SIO3I5]|uniref:hypothetical protein n=1 Tax=Okeania sp. SIO3I5 TaxID=2607805 RepID=UPI0013B7E493|nr:hypothetical protein [Okeania sp. SIO3I5]NEQ37006.1 hypothetical protein [Okeania sp. SIO3I5]
MAKKGRGKGKGGGRGKGGGKGGGRGKGGGQSSNSTKVKPLTPEEAKKIITEEERQEAARIMAWLNLDLINSGALTEEQQKKVLLQKLDAKLKDEKIGLNDLELGGVEEVTRIEIKTNLKE